MSNHSENASYVNVFVAVISYNS